MDSVVVYKANPQSLQAVLGFLRKQGFNPATLENPSNITAYRESTCLISITVPRDEAPGARSLLRKWDQTQELEAGKMTSKLAGPFLCSVAIVVVLAFIFLFFGILSDAAALLPVIGLVVFALLANAGKININRKKT